MAQIVYSRTASSDLQRLYQFLSEKNPDAARRAMRTIRDKLGALEQFPRLGPADPDRPGTRQLFMPTGAAGYVARYEVVEDTVLILTVRHMREAGYGDDPPKPSSPGRAPRRR